MTVPVLSRRRWLSLTGPLALVSAHALVVLRPGLTRHPGNNAAGPRRQVGALHL